MSGSSNAPRRIVPTGPLGPAQTPAPEPGRYRTHTAGREGPLGGTERGPDGFPVPPVDHWRGYGGTPGHYIELATRHVDSMLGILSGHGSAREGAARVLDFGCAACPMLRLLAMRRPAWELWGCDIDPLAIDWGRRNLAPALRLFTCTTASHLPLAGAMFDIVYAGSVFTHIEHMADAWLLELARVLRPGGRLYVTIHDRAFIRYTIAHAREWPLTRQIIDHFGDDAAEGDWARRSMGTGSRANLFYDRAYFVRMASPALELAGAHERAYGDQTALVFARRG